jgi:serine/threonine protein phosphatase PrpC
MLCCDGFRHKIGEEEMLRYFAPKHMRSCEEMQSQIRKLIDMNMQQGETDNISAITILAESKNSDRDAPLSVMQEFCYTDSSELAE